MLVTVVSVSGWRSPSVSLLARSASSSNILASPCLPMSFSSRPMLSSKVSVSGWWSPCTSLLACRASSYSGLASSS